MSSDPSPPPASNLKGCLKWGLLAMFVIGAVVGFLLWRHDQEIKRSLARMRELEKQVTYQPALFSATVTFPSGPTTRLHDDRPAPWRGLPGEIATCPDDVEGQELAEFYQASEADALFSRPFADDTHPVIHRALKRLYEEDLDTLDVKVLLAGGIVLQETETGGWRQRVTLVPTPHGSKIVPQELTGETARRLEAASVPAAPELGKVVADPRNYNTGVHASRYTSRTDPQRKAEEEARHKHDRDSKRYRELHHHFYLVEAARDFGGGRVVILRRFGQVLGPESVTDAIETIQTMMSQTVPP